MKINNNFNIDKLIGMHKAEVLELLGEECNYFHFDEWIYSINKPRRFWGSRKINITITFKDDVVVKIKRN